MLDRLTHWSGLTFFLFLAGWMFAAIYLYAPLKVRRRQTISTSIEYTPVEVPDLPTPVAGVFYQASPALAGCGFRSLGTVSQGKPNSHQRAYVSLWSDGKTDSAQVIGITTPHPAGGVKTVTVVTFRTEFTDGTSIVTSNSPNVSCFPNDPTVDSVRCPDITDVMLLHRFHTARVLHDAGPRVPTLEHVTDPSTRLKYEHEQTYQRLIRVGYFKLNEKKQQYVPTYKGCYLTTYRLLPPWKQLLARDRNAKQDRTLRALGFGGSAEFRKMQSAAVPTNDSVQPAASV